MTFAGKADLFRRVSAVLERGGRLVLGDVVVPEASVAWEERDLAVLVAEYPRRPW